MVTEQQSTLTYRNRFKQVDLRKIISPGLVLEDSVIGYRQVECDNDVPIVHRSATGEYGPATITVKLTNEAHFSGDKLHSAFTWLDIEYKGKDLDSYQLVVLNVKNALQDAYNLKAYDPDDHKDFPDITKMWTEKNKKRFDDPIGTRKH